LLTIGVLRTTELQLLFLNSSPLFPLGKQWMSDALANLYWQTRVFCVLRTVCHASCRFAMKGLPRGPAEQAEQAYFSAKSCSVLLAAVWFRNRRSGKSSWRCCLEKLNHFCSTRGKPMVRLRQNALTKHT